MLARLNVSLVIAIVSIDTARSVSAQATTPRAVLDAYCVTCHNERLRTANLTLDTLDPARAGDAAATWEKVVRKMRTGTMPPVGRPRPDQTAYDDVASALEATLDQAAAAHPDPGRPSIHRLNRAEYANVIRDLLALEVDVRSLLPPDDSAYGFDNNADAMVVSPGLLERYMSAAKRIARLAVGDVAQQPAIESYEVSRYRVQDDRTADDTPFGTRGGLTVTHTFPVSGEYVVRVHLQRRRSQLPQDLEIRIDGERVRTFAVRAARPTDDGQPEPPLETRVSVSAGPRQIGVAFARKAAAVEGLSPAQLPVGNIAYRGRAGYEVGVERIDVGGPHNPVGPGDTPSRRALFVCTPRKASEEGACARRILTTLIRRAYRHPATDRDAERIMPFYQQGHADGGFDSGIRRAIERVLVDPQFLFRIERDPASVRPGAAYRLSPMEVASRLSFFLWSSMPDDELLAAAERGRLSTPADLEQQVGRMLASPKARALVDGFAGQWLHLRNIEAVTPDVNAFPAFDDNLRQAFQQETELFLLSQIQNDRPVAELLNADYTFVNERLARHYGIAHVYGSHFRRVALADRRRGGLLGHGSILTVTSYADRTSPVVRGKWLLENVLGAPPPAPPPNVPALPDNTAGGSPKSVRERMEQHRRNPACASCHAKMDPLGFALEHFDAIGQWRSMSEAGTPIDASGTLPDGRKFDGATELRALLLERGFAPTIVEKLLTYALGRGLDASDLPAVRHIVRDAAPSGYRWSALIAGVVKSTPFRMRRAET
ncbi:MAG: DUF1592 domain-containing protein [Acidimicrobiia bacterium]|nr:DUF1592 domain-containing protein [Acidimicrobiia bacterium]